MTVGFDLEWTRERIDVLGLAWDGGRQATATDANPTTMAQMLDTLKRADCVVGQNILDADCRMLAKEGHDVSWIYPKARDIRLMMHAVNPHLAGSGSYDLRSIVLLMDGQQGYRFPLEFKQYVTDLHRTCGMDAAAALWAYGALERQVRLYKLERAVDIAHKCAPIFALMRDQGIRLNQDILRQIHAARAARTEELIEKYKLWEERGKKKIKRVPIWRSNKILDIFEENFGVRPKDRTRITWQKLMEDPSLSDEGREFAKAVVDLGRGANDATFVGKAEEDDDGELSFSKLDKDGFIHPRYDLCGSPDRAIASGPNIQQWPRPSDDPRPVKLRSAVVALDDSHVILGCDFGSVETYTNAIESNDWDRVRAIQDGRLSHEGTAALVNSAFNLGLNRNQGKACNHAFDKGECVDPSTLVLKTDLTWVPASDLKVDDELIGFDEQFDGKKSRFRRSLVQKVGRVTNPCYLVETDKGSMIASANHAWVARTVGYTYKWKTTTELKIGKQLKFFGSPWMPDLSHAAGSLCGFFDGEGNISVNGYTTAATLSVSQNEGPTNDHYRSLLDSLGYGVRVRGKAHKNSSKLCVQTSITNRYDALRFLGSVRPVRLLPKASLFWEGASVANSRYDNPATITNITFLGEQETVALKTSTKTLITNGFLTHNSPYNLARRLFKSDRPSRQQTLQCESIFRKMLEEYPKTSQFRDELWERAQSNPLVVTNSFGRRLACFSRSKYGDSNSRFAKHNPYKKYWCPCGDCSPRRDRWKYAIAFLGRSAAFDALLRVMAKIYYEKRLDDFSLPLAEVHDELDYSVPSDKVQLYTARAIEAFTEPFDELGGISLPADVKVGKTWATAH